MTAVVVAFAALLGLAIGSFLNVVVWRVPRRESLITPSSACPVCGHPIRVRDNVPVLSWLLLRGRCRDCHAPISRRYPMVEAVTAFGFAAVTWWAGLSWTVPALWYLVAISVPLVLIDLDVRRLPDAIVLPSYPVAAALLALAALNPGGTTHWTELGRAGIGALAMLAVYTAPRLIVRHGMGLGDVKLSGVLGLYLGWAGWGSLFVGWFSAFLLGGVFSIGLILTRRASRKSTVPFGPWMIAGAWLGLAIGGPLGAWYLGMFSA